MLLRLYPKKASNFRAAMNDDAAISNATTKVRIWYDDSVHMGDGCKQQLCIQNCGQTAADS